MTKRENGFDATKGAAIILVVFGHVWLGLGGAGLISDAQLFRTVEDAIYLFHMPVFFFVSGLFFAPKAAPGAFFQHKALTLLWPLLLWSWIEGAALLASGQGAERGLSGLLDVVAYPVPVKSVFWFLWALFVLQAGAYLVQRAFRAGAMVVMLGLAIASVLFFFLGLDPGMFVTIVENAPYFLVGVLMRSIRKEFTRPLPMPFVVGVLMLILSEVVHLKEGGGAPWFQIIALLAVMGFCGMFARIGGTWVGGALAWLGARTMPIYLIHIILTAATRVALLKLGITGVGLHLVAGVLIGIVAPLMVDAVVQRLGWGLVAGFGKRPARRLTQS